MISPQKHGGSLGPGGLQARHRSPEGPLGPEGRPCGGFDPRHSNLPTGYSITVGSRG